MFDFYHFHLSLALWKIFQFVLNNWVCVALLGLKSSSSLYLGGIAHIGFKSLWMHTQGCQKARYFVRNLKNAYWVKSKTIQKYIKIPSRIANCLWFYSMMGEWLTWHWVVSISHNLSDLLTPLRPLDLYQYSVVFAENEIWKNQFLPVCSWHWQNRVFLPSIK